VVDAAFAVVATGWTFVFLVLPNSRLRLAMLMTTVAVAWLVGTFFRRGVFTVRRTVFWLLASAILLPRIPVSSLPDARPELPIVFVAAALWLLMPASAGLPTRIRSNGTLPFWGLFAASVAWSTYHATMFLGAPTLGRDLWELFKILYYFLLFFFVANVDWTGTDVRRLVRFTLLALGAASSFGFAQFLDVAGVNALITPYYTEGAHLYAVVAFRRVVGTSANPNEFGAMMVLAAALSLACHLWWVERFWRWLAAAVFIMACLATALTLSRSSLVALGLVLTLILVYLYPASVGVVRAFRRYLPVLVLAGAVVALLYPYTPEHLVTRVQVFVDLASDASLSGRRQIWRSQVPLWLSSPVFGWGPAKGFQTTIVDNEWLFLLRRYGLVGVAAFLALFGSIFVGLSRIRRRAQGSDAVPLVAGLQATLLGYAAIMVVGNIYHSLQIMPLLAILLGLAYSRSTSSVRLEISDGKTIVPRQWGRRP